MNESWHHVVGKKLSFGDNQKSDFLPFLESEAVGAGGEERDPAPLHPLHPHVGGESGLMGGGGTALFPVGEKIPREPVPGLCPAPALPWQDCVVCSESTRGGTSDSGKVPSLPWASVSPSVQGVDEIVSVSKLSDCPPTLTF